MQGSRPRVSSPATTGPDYRFYITSGQAFESYNKFGEPWYRMPSLGFVHRAENQNHADKELQGYFQSGSPYPNHHRTSGGFLPVSPVTIVTSRLPWLIRVDQHTYPAHLG
jgi:hypothetical protein